MLNAPGKVPQHPKLQVSYQFLEIALFLMVKIYVERQLKNKNKVKINSIFSTYLIEFFVQNWFSKFSKKNSIGQVEKISTFHCNRKRQILSSKHLKILT
jgi:hypothetical protein